MELSAGSLSVVSLCAFLFSVCVSTNQKVSLTMKWLNEFSLIMRSNVTTLRESIEDPERMLHQLLIDMEDELDQVRGSVAEAIADEIGLRKRVERENADVETWRQRAGDSVQRQDDVSAEAAIQKQLACQARVQQIAADHERQRAAVEKLQRSVTDLEDKIRQAKHKKTLLIARSAQAKSTQKVNAALERTNSRSAFAQFDRMEQEIDRQEAMTEAWDRLNGRDPDEESVTRQFEAAEQNRTVQIELQRLKMKVDAGVETGRESQA